jgi:hypothetical protein
VRLPEDKIKKAILHPEEEVRLIAVSYFSGAWSQDETVMPLVIQAVERYGRDTAFHILRDAESLLQTEASIDWLINELRRDYDLADLVQEDYRFAVAVVLSNARPPFLGKRLLDVLSAPAFPELLVEPLQERLDMFSWDWDRGWSALENLGRDTTRRKEFTGNDIRYADRLIESLARHGKNAPFVLVLLERDYGDKDEALMAWLEPLIINLAGRMRLDEVIPSIVERLHEGNLYVIDDCFKALSRIANDAVVQAIEDECWEADEEFRSSRASVLDRRPHGSVR